MQRPSLVLIAMSIQEGSRRREAYSQAGLVNHPKWHFVVEEIKFTHHF